MAAAGAGERSLHSDLSGAGMVGSSGQRIPESKQKGCTAIKDDNGAYEALKCALEAVVALRLRILAEPDSILYSGILSSWDVPVNSGELKVSRGEP